MFDRRIIFAVDLEAGLVYSRVGDQVAVPVPVSGGIRLRNATEPEYALERFPAYAIRDQWSRLHCTQQIPLRVQNIHRDFWRLPKLSPPKPVDYQRDNPPGRSI